MTKQKTQILKTRIIGACLIIFLTLATTAFLQETQAQNNNTTANWNLNMTLQVNNGTKVSINQNPTFAPFDLIQLNANLTKGNLTAPNTPVVFKVEGPTSSSYPTEIVRSSITDNASSANIIFRIPLETSEKTVQGTWQIFANANTSNGTIQQNATFKVAWPIQVSSINFLDSKNQNQSTFAPGNTSKAIFTLSSNQEQPENVDINIQDANKNIINQTQLQNISFNATNANQIAYQFTIPNNTELGVATLNLAIFSGSYQGMAVPAAQNTTVNFVINNNAITNTTPTNTSTPTPTAPPFIENAVSLFSWVLIATGLFTFTCLVLFLKRKPSYRINTQIPITQQSGPNQIVGTLQSQPPEQQLASPTAKIASEKTLNSSLTQMPSIYETLNIPTSESTSPQEQEQNIINQLTKISSANQRVQALQSELKIEKEYLRQRNIDSNPNT